MDQKRLNEILAAHKAWLERKPEGRKANFLEANLRGADLREANLRRANLRGADLWGADLRGADLWGADLRGADLRRANLRGADLWEANLRGADLWEADLRGADLREANIDYACWPLWCGSLDVKVDARIAAQLAYHFCCLGCEEPNYIAARNAILDFANTFHRAEECGKLEEK